MRTKIYVVIFVRILMSWSIIDKLSTLLLFGTIGTVLSSSVFCFRTMWLINCFCYSLFRFLRERIHNQLQENFFPPLQLVFVIMKFQFQNRNVSLHSNYCDFDFFVIWLLKILAPFIPLGLFLKTAESIHIIKIFQTSVDPPCNIMEQGSCP